MRDRPILIGASSFNVRSGGQVVLHKLCHMLRNRGQDARLWMVGGHGSTYKHWRTPVANGRIWPGACVAIFPMAYWFTPLITRRSTKHRIIWLLSPANGIKRWEGKMVPADLTVSYSNSFSHQLNDVELLYVFEAWQNFFQPIRGLTRAGGCFTVRHGKRRLLPQTRRFKRIGRDYSFKWLRRVFSSRRIFHSYSARTGLAVIAALCGCESIVIPDGRRTREQWLAEFPVARYGIAYGLDDRERAEQTRELLRPNLVDVEAESYKQVDNLIEHIRALG